MRVGNATVVSHPHPWWRQAGYGILIVLFVTYCLAIFLDLPPPAGNSYPQDIPASVLMKWGVKADPNGLSARHWWYKTQALRGWSMHPEGWAWPKLVPVVLVRWLAILVLGLFGAAALYWLERRTVQRPSHGAILALVALIVFAYALQLGTLWLKGQNPEQLLLDRITNSDFTGYFDSALQIDDLSDFFSKYDRTMRSPNYCSHCRTHPPGPVLFYWLLIRAVDYLPRAWQLKIDQFLISSAHLQHPGLRSNAAIVAMLSGNIIVLLAATIVIPLYGLALRLGGQKLALSLTALGTVMPGLILMSPELDQFYGTLSAALFYTALRGLDARDHNGWWGLSTGLLFAFSLYWSFGLSVLAIPLALLAIAAMGGVLGKSPESSEIASIHIGFRSAIYWLAGLGLGTLIPWFLLWGLGRLHLLSVLDAALLQAHLHGVIPLRPYVPWLFFNLVGFLQFVGLPLVLVTILVLFLPDAHFIRTEDHQQASSLLGDLIRRVFACLPTNINFYSLLFWGVVLMLDLSGTARGEVERIWIFLMPLAVLPIFYAAGRGRLQASHIHLLLAAQFLVCVFIGGNWLTP